MKMDTWTEKRYSFLRFMRRFCKVKEGQIAPKWMYFVYYILFPLNWLYEKQAYIKYDILTDVYTIRGMKFTGEVFYHLKQSRGMRFEIVDTGEYVTLKKIQ